MNDIFGVGDLILRILLRVIRIGFVFIFLAFFWGIGLFIRNSDGSNAKGLEEGKQWMLWSVIALFVAITLWGLVAFLQGTVRADSVIIPPLGGSSSGDGGPGDELPPVVECSLDGWCNPNCSSDLDCPSGGPPVLPPVVECSLDGWCNPNCSSDLDCP